MYSRQNVIIRTKITDEKTIQRIINPIVEFANKHEVGFLLGFNEENKLTASYEISGKTSAYCKGIITEIKQMLKDAFNCKIEVIFYIY